MKRFQYQLETVLNYKYRVLDDLKSEHARILRNVNQKQEEIKRLNDELIEYETEFDQTKREGTSIERYRLFGMCIEKMEQVIDEEKEQLKILQKKEEKKKEEVVEAKVDSSKYEKLKERKWQEYQKLEQKVEEAFVEEFVTRSYVREGISKKG